MFLINKNTDLAFLQETKLCPGIADTQNYARHLFGDRASATTHRGIANLISKLLSPSIFMVSKISENIAALHTRVDGVPICFINAYIPGDKKCADEIGKMAAYLSTQNVKITTMVVGDFNAHIGRNDITVGDNLLIGRNLFHERDNDNGTDLKNSYTLQGYTSKTLFKLRNPSI